MDLRQLYELAGGKYEDVLGRLMDEARIKKYLNKFVITSDYADMMEAVTAGDWQTAFRTSHNIKGMCLNLGLNNLAKASSDLCEAVRHGAPQGDISELVSAVEREYAKNVAAIKEMDE